MKRTQLLSRAAGALVIAAALAGCGGGGGGGGNGFYPFPVATTPPPQDGQPPVEQVSAYDAFLAYIVALVGTQLDHDDTANVAQFDPPPTSETKDPVATP